MRNIAEFGAQFLRRIVFVVIIENKADRGNILALRPSGNSGWNASSFRFEKEAFFVLARKLRGCAE
ncbi:MAG: hypothetical protein ACLP51_08135, partial [Syntrophobacteraceae bacterium]